MPVELKQEARFALERQHQVLRQAGGNLSSIVKVDVYVKGPGSGRETAIRSLQNTGIEVSGIKDVTPMPHNGCRPKKRRRV